jgi:hypothetical protein
MAKAITAARNHQFDQAAEHLKAAQEDIDTVVSILAYICESPLTDEIQAKALDCTFIQLCGQSCPRLENL